MMLPFYNLHLGIYDILKQIWNHDAYTDIAIKKSFQKNQKWGKRDRAFVAETVYDIIRWQRKICFYAEIEHASDDIWKIMTTYFLLENQTLPDFIEYQNMASSIDISKNIEKQPPSVRLSYPEEYWNFAQKELGESWLEEAKVLNEKAKLCIRFNQLKISKEDLVKILEKENLSLILEENYPDGILIDTPKDLTRLAAYKEGLFEIQDFSSQSVAPFTEVKPNDLVIDACAGGGGKALHLAQIMKNKGKIIASDIYPKKLEQLNFRAQKAGISIIETEETNTEFYNKYRNLADVVLIDAPCSGSGTIRRSVDAKWKMPPNRIQSIIKTQENILAQTANLLKNNGLLIYATCSIFPSENQKQVEKFLSNHPHFSLEKEKAISPKQSRFDGFYMAALRKSNP